MSPNKLCQQKEKIQESSSFCRVSVDETDFSGVFLCFVVLNHNLAPFVSCQRRRVIAEEINLE